MLKKLKDNFLLKKKKANLSILFIALFIIIYFMMGTYINIRSNYEFFNRFQKALEETADYRAQAVDTYLKESYNIIEALHSESNYGDGENTSDIDHQKLSDENPVGQLSVLNPHDDAYISALEKADEDAKKMFVDIMNLYINSNQNNKIIPNLSTDNVCIDVQPLPETGNPITKTGTVTFSCTAKLITEGSYGSDDVNETDVDPATPIEEDSADDIDTESGSQLEEIEDTPLSEDEIETEHNINEEDVEFEQTLTLASQDNKKLRKFVYDPNGIPDDQYADDVNDDEYTQVVNAVFVAAAIENRNLLANFFNAVSEFFGDLSNLSYSKKSAYAVAYPQSDRCYGDKCTNGDYTDVEK